MDCIEKGTPPPIELKIDWACQRLNTLPEVGAYYDQDAQLIARMTALSNIYNALSRMRNLTGRQIHNLTDNERKILGHLVDLGLIFNG